MKLKFAILTMFLALYSGQVKAEYCDMVGCGRDVIKWIYIPKAQYGEMLDKPELKLNDISYSTNNSKRLFKETGLPEVNAVAELNVDVASTNLPECLLKNSCSADEQVRWATIADIDRMHSGIHLDKKQKLASYDDRAYTCSDSRGKIGCWDFNQGMKLRILSYNTIEDVLFALVQVQN